MNRDFVGMAAATIAGHLVKPGGTQASDNDERVVGRAIAIAIDIDKRVDAAFALMETAKAVNAAAEEADAKKEPALATK